MGGFNILGTLGKVAGGVAKTAFPWAGALGALGSIGSSILGNTGSFKRQKYSDRQNIAFWNMQNKYNHPLQQMQRLQEAGLNPNLIYGQSVAGATGQADQVAPSKAAPYSIQNPVPSAINAITGTQQAKLMAAQSINQIAAATKYGKETEKISKLLPIEIENYTNLAKKSGSEADIKAVEAKIAKATTKEQITKIINESDTSGYVNQVKQAEAEYASRGLRMDQIGQIFTALNMNPRNSTDQKIFQGLMTVWYSTGLLSKILSPQMVKLLASKFNLKL